VRARTNVCVCGLAPERPHGSVHRQTSARTTRASSHASHASRSPSLRVEVPSVTARWHPPRRLGERAHRSGSCRDSSPKRCLALRSSRWQSFGSMATTIAQHGTHWLHCTRFSAQASAPLERSLRMCSRCHAMPCACAFACACAQASIPETRTLHGAVSNAEPSKAKRRVQVVLWSLTTTRSQTAKRRATTTSSRSASLH
jgi:hypothetical protein